MSLLSRFEAPIEIPTGDWTAVLTESGGGGTPTITLAAARKYYWSNEYSGGGDPGNLGLAARLKADLDTASPNARTYTVTVDATSDSAAGKLTISVDSGTFTLTTVSADLLALMGFTGDLSPTAASHVGQNAVEALHLPDCPANAPYGLSTAGRPMSQAVPMVAPDGTYSLFQGSSMTRNQLEFRTQTKHRTITAEETTTNSSYQSFWLDAVYGEEPWANAGQKIQFFPDRAAAGSFVYNVMNANEPQYERLEDEHDNYYSIALDLVQAV